MKKNNVMLIGLGPHAKRIYINYFKKHKINLEIVLELESKFLSTRFFLDINGFKSTKIVILKDKYKDYVHLPYKIEESLYEVCRNNNITHIIISTEPKAHNMYLEFALKYDINVLTDKPITTCKNLTNINSIKKVRKQYYNLYKLSEYSNCKCNVMCQRQYHRGYEYIKKILNEVVSKYQIPITYIDIYHCDGNWEMPHDLFKENHPYKYGYGKLFHSGYHFIDLLSDLLKINNQLPKEKKIKYGEIYSNCFTPNDEINIFNIEDYKRIFRFQNIPDYYFENERFSFPNFGEKNFYGLLHFSNKKNKTITTANLNLLHYGFSRRGWIESKDYYKNNGRIRHERINIQVGPLMNIQVHSYQSKEIKDRTNDISEELTGGLEHFDIDIYRNVDIIGGVPYERIKLGDLYSDKEKKNILGYNELSREIYLNNFFNGTSSKGDIKDQSLSVEILYSAALGIHNYYENKKVVEDIKIDNKYIYPFKLELLKPYAKFYYKNSHKELLLNNIIKKFKTTYGININYIEKKNIYEIYIYIQENKILVSGLLTKIFQSKFMAYLYFYALNVVINNLSTKIIQRLLQNKYLLVDRH